MCKYKVIVSNALGYTEHWLSWQRVWMIPPSEASVAALSWRPDGKGNNSTCESDVIPRYVISN